MNYNLKVKTGTILIIKIILIIIQYYSHQFISIFNTDSCFKRNIVIIFKNKILCILFKNN